MKKWITRILIFIAILIAIIVIIGYSSSEKEPQTTQNKEADLLAQKMLDAIDIKAWDSLKYLTFDFKNIHKYLWDKQANQVKISWAEYLVLMKLDTQKGVVYKNGEMLSENLSQAILEEAWGYWCNDSFWMFAPFKVFDPGTSRSLAKDEEGKDGLMVTYNSGGVTPGDKYLWFLDQNYIPTGFKIWVKVIPIGGVYFTWENWITLSGGAKLATSHLKAGIDLKMEDVKEGVILSDLGESMDLFGPLETL